MFYRAFAACGFWNFDQW